MNTMTTTIIMTTTIMMIIMTINTNDNWLENDAL